jgi:outer membrane protein, multidrug efflux system
MTKLPKLAAIAFVVLAAAGCAVGPDYVSPVKVGDIQIDTAYQQALESTSWWQAFNDEELNRLISIALQQNRSLAKAEANVERAMAVFIDAENDDWPKATFDSNYQVSKNTNISTLDDNLVNRGATLGANLNWDIDLFGKIKRASQAAQANAEQAEALLQDAQVQIISQVATSYGDVRGAQMRLKVAQENLDNLQQTRQIINTRVNAGFVSEFELARIDAQFYEIKAQLPVFQRALLQAKSALSALLGLTSDQLVVADESHLPQLSQPVVIQDSRKYLHYRADIASAERALAASTANIGVRTADLYPSLSVNGFLGFVSSPGLTLNGDTKGWSVAPSLSWQVGDLGSVKAQIKAANATAKMALADFEQLVFTALNEIQLSLDEYKLSREQQLLIESQFKASTKAMIIARVKYEAGNGEFYDLLDAERDWLRSRDQLAQVQQLSFTKLVTIYRVFGGGLEINQLKS